MSAALNAGYGCDEKSKAGRLRPGPGVHRRPYERANAEVCSRPVKADLIEKLLILRAQATLLRRRSENGLPIGSQSLRNLERVTLEFLTLMEGAA